MKQILLALVLIGLSASAACAQEIEEKPLRPNILWITSEDNGPHLGCYGDEYADTPNIDALAANGMLYKRAWSNAPVCAPARTAVISGLYPPATGSEHMRSNAMLPEEMRMFPVYLREAGYYCTNNRKEDYNLVKVGEVWDESSGKAHWRNRAEGQPFFAVFNFTTTHESQIRKRPHEAKHDPAQVPLPAYHPDTPEVRQDWAQYYDKITEMDKQVARVLTQLKDDGLEQDTIVFYYGDHGSGMPRNKRWPYNSGLHVPLVVHVPEKFQHLAPEGYRPGGKSDRLVSFVDLAPTVLSLAGIEPLPWMQGLAIMGQYSTAPPQYMFGFRGRMDERYDMVRSCTDGRFVYIRNFMPHKIYGQYLDYMFQTPTTRVWKDLYDAGKLNEAQSRFWQTKPSEELYDLTNDPDEIHNLADDPRHRDRLSEMRATLRKWQEDIRDIGFLPEEELHTRGGKLAPYTMGHDPELYPLKRIQTAAERASARDPNFLSELVSGLEDKDSAVRYWSAMGLVMLGETAVAEAREPLRNALRDESNSVRCLAAEALGRYGNTRDVELALEELGRLANPEKTGVFVAVLALNAIDSLGSRAAPLHGTIKNLPDGKDVTLDRMNSYVPRLLKNLSETLSRP